jgi:chromosomal replication initiator protein
MALARVALADLIRHAIRVVQLDDLDRAICKVLRLEPGTLQTKRRTWTVSHPRMLAIFLARKHTSAAYSEIGHYFGGRTHSTAVIAEKKIRHALRDDEPLMLGDRRVLVREIVELVEKELQR